MPSSGCIGYVNGDPTRSFGVVFYVDSGKLEEVKKVGGMWSVGWLFDTKTGSKNYLKKSACYLNYWKSTSNDKEAG